MNEMIKNRRLSGRYLVLGGFLALLFSLDVATTTMALDIGGQECNAFMVGLVENPLVHAAVKAAAAGVLMFLIVRCDRVVPYAGTFTLMGVCAFYVYGVVRNFNWLFAHMGVL